MDNSAENPSDHSGEETVPPSNKKRGTITTQKYILGLVTIFVAAVAYYFFYALPEHNRTMESMERGRLWEEQRRADKADRERQQKEAAAEREDSLRETFLNLCIHEAETAYWDYIKLNGKPVPGKPEVYTAPQYVWDRAREEKEAALAECHRKYGK